MRTLLETSTRDSCSRFGTSSATVYAGGRGGQIDELSCPEALSGGQAYRPRCGNERLQGVLGHKILSTTEPYLRMKNEELRAILELLATENGGMGAGKEPSNMLPGAPAGILQRG